MDSVPPAVYTHCSDNNERRVCWVRLLVPLLSKIWPYAHDIEQECGCRACIPTHR
jgi:hypothetical protein